MPNMQPGIMRTAERTALQALILALATVACCIQLAIPMLPSSMRYLAWFFSLLQAGLFAYIQCIAGWNHHVRGQTKKRWYCRPAVCSCSSRILGNPSWCLACFYWHSSLQGIGFGQGQAIPPLFEQHGTICLSLPKPF